MSVLVFVSRDFELGRTWLAGGVDRQSRTGLIFLAVYQVSFVFSRRFVFAYVLDHCWPVDSENILSSLLFFLMAIIYFQL